ncbi:MAG: esterase-like activity of phytase family protein [Nibricoccus sp.]
MRPAFLLKSTFTFLPVFTLGFSLLSTPGQCLAATVEFNGLSYANLGLVGVGRLPADQRDKFGETFGSFSDFTLDASSWKRNDDGSYTGTLYAQPDRGYNLTGTTNYIPRQNRLTIRLVPASGSEGKADNLSLTLADTVLYTEADGSPLTAFDPTPAGAAARPNFPPLPQAYNGRISLDAEGLVRLADGSFFVSDEYGPYVYRFSETGKLLAAIRPPETFIPKRRGVDSFSSNNAGPDHAPPSPAEPDSGRANNQGFEGLSLTPDAKTLFVLLQSATHQDGGTGGSAPRRHTRLLKYDISADTTQPRLTGDYVVALPEVQQPGKRARTAPQSAIVAISPTRLLMLSRGSGGAGGETPASNFRQITFVDFTAATNLLGTPYEQTTAVAPGGTLAAAVTPAQTAPFIDINDDAELKKFALSNGPVSGATNLAEKWEALTLAPVLDPKKPDDFFLLVGNDNDFQTMRGFQDGQAYKAENEIDSMILVYRVTLPGLNSAKP